MDGICVENQPFLHGRFCCIELCCGTTQWALLRKRPYGPKLFFCSSFFGLLYITLQKRNTLKNLADFKSIEKGCLISNLSRQARQEISLYEYPCIQENIFHLDQHLAHQLKYHYMSSPVFRRTYFIQFNTQLIN